MDLKLAGKTAIVTGGASNIGRGITLAFAQEGANVVIADFDESQAQKVAKEAQGLLGKVIAVMTDVTDWNQVQTMVKKTLDEFKTIDVLVNNAGGGHDFVEKLFVEQTREEWEKIVALNFWGVMSCTRAVLDHMIERRSGSIVNIGSDAGRMGEYREGVYAGCKAGVIGLSKTLARELGRYGIRVNVVCPGTTLPDAPVGEKSLWAEGKQTASWLSPEMLEKAAKGYPLRKFGKPQDIADAVTFFASERAGHITGQTLSVSGGYTMM